MGELFGDMKNEIKIFLEEECIKIKKHIEAEFISHGIDINDINSININAFSKISNKYIEHPMLGIIRKIVVVKKYIFENEIKKKIYKGRFDIGVMNDIENKMMTLNSLYEEIAKEENTNSEECIEASKESIRKRINNKESGVIIQLHNILDFDIKKFDRRQYGFELNKILKYFVVKRSRGNNVLLMLRKNNVDMHLDLLWGKIERESDIINDFKESILIEADDNYIYKARFIIDLVGSYWDVNIKQIYEYVDIVDQQYVIRRLNEIGKAIDLIIKEINLILSRLKIKGDKINYKEQPFNILYLKYRQRIIKIQIEEIKRAKSKIKKGHNKFTKRSKEYIYSGKMFVVKIDDIKEPNYIELITKLVYEKNKVDTKEIESVINVIDFAIKIIKIWRDSGMKYVDTKSLSLNVVALCIKEIIKSKKDNENIENNLYNSSVYKRTISSTINNENIEGIFEILWRCKLNYHILYTECDKEIADFIVNIEDKIIAIISLLNVISDLDEYGMLNYYYSGIINKLTIDYISLNAQKEPFEEKLFNQSGYNLIFDKDYCKKTDLFIEIDSHEYENNIIWDELLDLICNQIDRCVNSEDLQNNIFFEDINYMNFKIFKRGRLNFKIDVKRKNVVFLKFSVILINNKFINEINSVKER